MLTNLQALTAPRTLSLHFFVADLLKSYSEANPRVKTSFDNTIPIDTIIHSRQVGPLLGDLFDIFLQAANNEKISISYLGQGESIRLTAVDVNITSLAMATLAA